MSPTRANKAAQPEVVPTSPQTIPTDWAQERDAGHLWNAISGLSSKTGELSAAIAAGNTQLAEMRTDFKGLDGGIHELKTEQIAVAKSIKVFGYIATPLLALAAIAAPYWWTKTMRPDLEKSIAESVKADIERENASKEKTNVLERKIQDLEARLKAQSQK